MKKIESLRYKILGIIMVFLERAVNLDIRFRGSLT